MIPVATADKEKNGDGKEKVPDTVKAPPMTREQASGNFSSRTFYPEHSSALHPLIRLLLSYSSPTPLFPLFPLSLLLPYSHVFDSMVLQGTAQIQCAPIN